MPRVAVGEGRGERPEQRQPLRAGRARFGVVDDELLARRRTSIPADAVARAISYALGRPAVQR